MGRTVVAHFRLKSQNFRDELRKITEMFSLYECYSDTLSLPQSAQLHALNIAQASGVQSRGSSVSIMTRLWAG